MGWENRDYARGSRQTNGFQVDLDWPIVCKYIIWSNIIIYLGQLLYARPITVDELRELTGTKETSNSVFENRDFSPTRDKQASESIDAEESLRLRRMFPRVSPVQNVFQIDSRKIMQGQVWRIFTGAFCHDRHSAWHILFNMLALFWFGPTLERMYGSREFFLFYFSAIFVSSLAVVGLDLWLGRYIPAIGASGAVMAVFALYAIHFPYRQIRVFFIIPVEIRWLLLFYCIYDLHPVLLALSGEQVFTGVAHAGHLGGLAFGFIYWRYQLRLEFWLPKNRPTQQRSTTPSRPTIKMYTPENETPLEEFPDAGDEFDAQVDELLQKVGNEGKESLTDEELEILKRASDWYKRRENL